MVAGNNKSSNAMTYTQLAKQSTNRKNVVTSGSSPAETLKKSMSTMNALQDLHEGIPVLKVSYTGAVHRRILTLNKEQCALFITHSKVNDETHASKLPRPTWTPTKGWYATYQRYVDVADLVDVQVGVVGTRVLEGNKKAASHRKEVVDSIVTIYHHEYLGRKSLNLFIENSNHRTALVEALQTMRRHYDDQEQWVGREILLMRYIWYDIDVDKNHMVSEREFGRVCDRINLYVDGGVHKKFREFVKTNKIQDRKSHGKELTYGECTKLLASLKGNQAVDAIWKDLFGIADSVSAKTFLDKFLHATQGEKDATAKDAENLISVLNSIELGEGSDPASSSKLEKGRFEEFLRSEWNDAFDPTMQELPKKGLTKPLSAYWVNSSHNTYLTGDQLQSRSSVEAYTAVLQRGCKCLELDVWDGSSRRGKAALMPIIYHGHTMTSKIELYDVLLVVNSYLLKNPDAYPIVLSIENHCSIPYQEAMAKLIKSTFGGKLYIPTVNQRTVQMPSPEDLKGKVVIKGKRPPEPDDSNEEDDEEGNQEAAKPTTKGKEEAKNDEPPEYARTLLDITYFHGTKFKTFEKSIGLMPSHMHSINETKIVKLTTKTDKNPDLWREYNSTHFTRTYPAGTRVDSSNYNPVLAWAMGCQLVALNFQTPGSSMILNDGRFRQNGNCGYVEKPATIMTSSKPEPQTVELRILSASCLPKPFGQRKGENIDPFIRVELHDVRTEKGKEQYYSDKHVTKKVDNNGYSPSFEDKGKSFKVQNPDVAMFVFRVFDHDFGINDEIASAAIPVSCLRKGYRSIQLYDSCNSRPGPFHYATLLVHITL